MRIQKLGMSLLLLLMATFVSTVSAKENIVYGDYKLAEVTGNNINIRSGAGTQFPIAYAYVGFCYDVNNGTESWTKENVSPATKGARYWVKDAGDWWEIQTQEDTKDSKQFISKKFCRLMETDRLDVDSITSPRVYVYSEKGEGYEPGEIITSNIVITIYPGGDVVSQFWSEYGNEIAFGEINKEGTAIRNLVQTMFGVDSMDVAPTAPLEFKMWLDENPPMLGCTVGKKNMKSFRWKGSNVEYPDLSGVSLDEWNSIIQKLASSENFQYIRSSPENSDVWVTIDDLKKMRRIK